MNGHPHSTTDVASAASLAPFTTSTSLLAPTGTPSNDSLAFETSVMAFQLDGGAPFASALGTDDKRQDIAKKTLDEDFMNLPFDLSSAHSGLPSSYDAFAYAFAASATSLPPLPMLDTNPLILDRGLDSPLGLDSPYAEFLASPMFDDAGDVPPPLDFDYPSLFPPTPSTANSTPAPMTHLRSNPSPPYSTSRPSPAHLTFLPTLSASSTVPVSGDTIDRPRPTGFRGASTPLVSIDAPIQPRSYLLPSVTSRKRKTTAVERELAKRGCTGKSEDAAAAAEPIPSDLVAAVERKRLQNTIAARKSRQRKQERLGELEERNRELEQQNDELKRRVEQLEVMLRGVGLTP